MNDNKSFSATLSDGDSKDCLTLPARSPRRERKKNPIFFVSDQFDCIITAPPESKKKEGNVHFAEVFPTKNGYENIGYQQERDCLTLPKAGRVSGL